MALQDVSGSVFISTISSDIIADDGLPFGSYLTFGSLAGETWNTQQIDPEASKQAGNFKSAEGSKFSFSETTTDNSKKGGIRIGLLRVSCD